MSKKPKLQSPAEVRRRILHHLDGLAQFAAQYEAYDPLAVRVLTEARATLKANPLVEFRGAGGGAPDRAPESYRPPGSSPDSS